MSISHYLKTSFPFLISLFYRDIREFLSLYGPDIGTQTQLVCDPMVSRVMGFPPENNTGYNMEKDTEIQKQPVCIYSGIIFD